MSADRTVGEMMQVRLRLRPELRCSLQSLGATCYYQIEDPLTGRFYRLGRREWDVARRMDGQRRLGELIEQYGQSNVGEAETLSIADAVQLARWLVQSQLATVEGRLTHKQFVLSPRPRMLPAWLNPAFMRIPLGNPDALLSRCLPWFGWTLSPWAVLVWTAVCLAASYQIVVQWSRFKVPMATILAPHNWLYLLGAWIGLKAVHELYHGLICKRHGGRVPVCGIALILFSPVAFVDVTSSWKFRSKWQRIQTAAGGMYAELFVAALTVLLWANSDDGLLTQICHNVIVMASVSTLLFNGNCLMRFDGYYIVSDLLNIQNLYGNGQQYIRYLTRRYFLGVSTVDGAGTGIRGLIVRAYGIASLGWRILFYVGVVLTAATMFHGAGVIVSMIVGTLWILLPGTRFLHYLVFARGRDQPRRTRVAIVTTMGFAAVASVFVIPWPWGVVTTGIVDYEPIAHIRTAAPGFVRTVHVVSGQSVQAGSPLVTIENHRIEADLRDVETSLQQSEIRARMMQDDNEVASYQIEKTQQDSLGQQRRELADKVAGLQLTAPMDGRVIGRELAVLQDQYLPTGADLLAIGNDARKSIVVAVPQKDAEFFLNQLGTRPSVRVRGRLAPVRGARLVKMDPRATQSLSHQALAASNGGPLPVTLGREYDSGDAGHQVFTLTEPHFWATISLSEEEARELRAGQLARVRIRTAGQSIGRHLWGVVENWVRRKLHSR